LRHQPDAFADHGGRAHHEQVGGARSIGDGAAVAAVTP
jgi:hypothetical protein